MEARILSDCDARKYRELRQNEAREDGQKISGELRQELELFDQYQHQIMTTYASCGTRVWGAFDDQSLAGVVAMSYMQLAVHPRNLWLWGLYVRPKYRGTPASRVLMESVLRWSERNAPDCRLFGACDPLNVSALQFLHRYGFQLPADSQSLANEGRVPPRLVLVELLRKVSL